MTTILSPSALLRHCIFGAVNAAGQALSPALFHIGPNFASAGERIDHDPANA